MTDYYGQKPELRPVQTLAPKPLQPAPSLTPVEKPLQPASALRTPSESTFRSRCSACGSILEATTSQQIITCYNCGKRFKNPKYVAPEEYTPAEYSSASEQEERGYGWDEEQQYEAQSEEQPAAEERIFRFRCPGCGAILEATSSQRVVECASCGRKFRNPKYVEPAPAAPAFEAEPSAPSSAPTLTPVSAPTLTPAPAPSLSPVAFAEENDSYYDDYSESSSNEYEEDAGGYYDDYSAPAPDSNEPFVRYCSACGNMVVLDPRDEIVTCPSCGKQLSNPYFDPNASDSSLSDDSHTEFVGKSIMYFLINILNTLQLIVTLGLGTVWTKCRMLRWQYNNMVVNGKHLIFDGRGKEIFGKWFGWTLLQIITLGAYTFWKNYKMEVWYASHIHIEGEAKEGESYLDSTLETYVGTLALSAFTYIVTLGFGLFWSITRYLRWTYNCKVIDGYCLCYTASSWRLLGKSLVWWLLCIVTFGIAYFFLPRAVEKWLTAHTHLERI